jgi:hypothetical protein
MSVLAPEQDGRGSQSRAEPALLGWDHAVDVGIPDIEAAAASGWGELSPGMPPASLGLDGGAVGTFAAGAPIEPSAAFRPGSSFAASAATTPQPSAWRSSPVSRPAPPAAPSTLEERLIAVGGGIATVAFFLPWASAVIGSGPIPDPWDSFGIVGSWHLLAFLLTVGTVALSQSGDRAPAWLRLGVVPLAMAFLLVGIDWYYLLTPIGGWIGAYLLLVGAFVMAAGAVRSIRGRAGVERNAAAASTV